MTRGYPKKHHEAIRIPLVHPDLCDATSFAMFGDPVPEKDPEMAASDVDPRASAIASFKTENWRTSPKCGFKCLAGAQDKNLEGFGWIRV